MGDEGTAIIDTRYLLRLGTGPPDVLASHAAGETVDPARRYLRGTAAVRGRLADDAYRVT